MPRVSRAQNCERIVAHWAAKNRPGRLEIMIQEPIGELRIGLSATAVDPIPCESDTERIYAVVTITSPTLITRVCSFCVPVLLYQLYQLLISRSHVKKTKTDRDRKPIRQGHSVPIRLCRAGASIWRLNSFAEFYSGWGDRGISRCYHVDWLLSLQRSSDSPLIRACLYRLCLRFLRNGSMQLVK